MLPPISFNCWTCLSLSFYLNLITLGRGFYRLLSEVLLLASPMRRFVPALRSYVTLWSRDAKLSSIFREGLLKPSSASTLAFSDCISMLYAVLSSSLKPLMNWISLRNSPISYLSFSTSQSEPFIIFKNYFFTFLFNILN